MPNWTYTKMSVAGPVSDLIRFVAACVDDEGKPSLNHLHPCPKALRETVDGFSNDFERQAQMEIQHLTNKAEYGYKTWYDWAIDNWGSKWGACDVGLMLTAQECEVTFQAAWSPPVLLIQKISEMFPRLIFGMYHTEEFWHFYGYEVVRAGEVLAFFEKSHSEFPDFDYTTDEGLEEYHEWTSKVIGELEDSVRNEISFHLTEKESA